VTRGIGSEFKPQYQKKKKKKDNRNDHEAKSWFFEKISETDKSLISMAKKERKHKLLISQMKQIKV
jgi:hypothetical protein